MKNAGLVALVFVLFPIAALSAAQIAPPLDPAPFERPTPVATIHNVPATNLFAIAREVLTTNGFSIVNSDKRECSLEGKRAFQAADSNGTERVLLWMERTVAEPETIQVHLLFGRFIQVFGGKTGRLKLTKEDEERITGSWEPSLIESLKKNEP